MSDYSSTITDEGVFLGHIHYACLNKFDSNMFPDCCECTGHHCRSIQCQVPSASESMKKEVLSKMQLEVLVR